GGTLPRMDDPPGAKAGVGRRVTSSWGTGADLRRRGGSAPTGRARRSGGEGDQPQQTRELVAFILREMTMQRRLRGLRGERRSLRESATLVGRDHDLRAAVALIRFADDEVAVLQLVDEGDHLARVQTEEL